MKVNTRPDSPYPHARVLARPISKPQRQPTPVVCRPPQDADVETPLVLFGLVTASFAALQLFRRFLGR